MVPTRGFVVCSKAGRDSGNFMVVLETKDRVVLVADGKKRSIKRPKRKNLKHISLTQSVIPEEQLFTNKSIRHALSQLNANTCQGEI